MADPKNCFSKPEVFAEQFIPDHVFLYVTKGGVSGYDGNKTYTIKQGEYCLARKNRLAKYKPEKGEVFEKIIFCFEEEFLRDFRQRHQIMASKFDPADTFIHINPTKLIPDFIHSLTPYCDATGRLDEAFEDVKYEELLIILLKNQPELANVLFDFARPEKINLEEFMNRNYKFNVSVERFAYLTGRSISAFKRDFKALFNQTPNRWLVQKRLQEAFFLISQQHKKPTEIYLELGFEDLSHFSFALRKQFGKTAKELGEEKSK